MTRSKKTEPPILYGKGADGQLHEPQPTAGARASSLGPLSLPELEGEFSLHTGDALAWLKRLPSSSVDLIVTDPPYESLEKHRAHGTTTRLGGAVGRQGAASLPRTPHTSSTSSTPHTTGTSSTHKSNNVWFRTLPNSAFPALFKEFHRVLAPDSHLYLFCDSETMFVVKPMGEEAGFKFWKPLVWDKVQIGMGYHYRARYEFVLFFEKGKRRLEDLGVPDILEHARVRNGYPTEKPVSLARILISQSTSRGELVLDPFAGSGAFGEAALVEGRRFAGCDVNSSATLLQRARLKDYGREVK